MSAIVCFSSTSNLTLNSLSSTTVDSNVYHRHQPANTSHTQVPVAPDTLTQQVPAANIQLTGDAEADADIMAFLKARQNAMQLGGCQWSSMCFDLVCVVC